MIEPETIFVLSSGSGRAGVAVLRVSGRASLDVISALARHVPDARRFSLRKLFCQDGSLLDQAVVIWLPGPQTVTGEDMAEFHVHGSPAVVTALLWELSLQPQCRLAEPGEFTRRAFDNERLGLLEVEGLSDLLAAESEAQRRLAMRQFSGESTVVVEAWRTDLLAALALLEAAIDFSDEQDVAEQAVVRATAALESLRAELWRAEAAAKRLAAIRRGLRVVIAGPANAGKSSLLNWLAERDAAIVSATPGTTRDVVDASVMLSGVPVLLSDTAGLRDGSFDAIEMEGMAWTWRALADADVVVWVEAADVSGEPPPNRAPDFRLMNKADLFTNDSIQTRNESVIAISVKSGAGLGDFRSQLEALITARNSIGEHDVVVRERHRVAVAQSIRFLNDALERPKTGLELIAEDVRNAARALSLFTGRIDAEELLGKIFADFCIGK